MHFTDIPRPPRSLGWEDMLLAAALLIAPLDVLRASPLAEGTPSAEVRIGGAAVERALAPVAPVALGPLAGRDAPRQVFGPPVAPELRERRPLALPARAGGTSDSIFAPRASAGSTQLYFQTQATGSSLEQNLFGSRPEVRTQPEQPSEVYGPQPLEAMLPVVPFDAAGEASFSSYGSGLGIWNSGLLEGGFDTTPELSRYGSTYRLQGANVTISVGPGCQR